MKTGYCNPRPRFTLKAQVELLTAAGVPERRIYVEGERGETFDSACKAARDGILHCPDGFRVFGTSAKAIRAGLIAREKRGVVIVDAANGWRSDKNLWEMYDWAVGKGQAEERKLNRRKSREGGNARAAALEADRLEKAKAKPIWHSKRFDTNQAACEFMNNLHPPQKSRGWTTQSAFRAFGKSGRPRGNRAFALKKD